MTTVTENLPHAQGYLISEANGDLSRKAITVKSGQGILNPGTVLGKETIAAKTAAGAAGVPAPAAATITASPTAAITTKVGVHTFRCIQGGAGTASKWAHEDPDGEQVGVATGNTAYAGGGLSGLTITDASTDPVVGETFTVTVTEAAPSEKYVQYDQDGTTGSQNPAGILRDTVDATSADAAGVAHVQLCTVNAAELVWPDDIEAGEIAAALEVMAASPMYIAAQ